VSRLPWFAWTSLLSVTCILAGSYWDISWHMSIGRDSFWTPAHVAIQLGGIVAGVSGAVLIFTTTFSKTAPLRDASISVWGFRGPFGAFLGAWGAATMVVSAPFDNWWHAAYGLDVKILSPPHAVLTLGILAVAVGGVMLVAAATNRARDDARAHARLAWILLALGAEILVLSLVAITELTFRANLHRGQAYQAMAIVAPLILLVGAGIAPQRWTCTIVAGGYTAFMAAMVWLFPLFPAEPKLGPVYQPITHFIPLEFPLLVIAPAFAIDVIRARVAPWPRWRQAIVLGVAFVAVLLAAEWPFATFLSSPASRNWVFGTHYFAYFMRPEWYEVRGELIPDPDLGLGLAEAFVIAIATSWIGLAVGAAVRRVQR
jgi:hypothetical protein